MPSNTLTTLSTSFKDRVYTTLLDKGLDPGDAYEVANDSSDLWQIDEYGDALAVDEDSDFSF